MKILGILNITDDSFSDGGRFLSPDTARAHGEAFSKARPACTFVEVSRFIDPNWLIEIEVDAALPE